MCRKAAGGGVARVHVRLVARLDKRRVQVGERGEREVDLAADLDQLGHIVAVQPIRHVAHRADVGGDVFAGAPVAAGGRRGHEPTLLVGQVDREPIDLQLAQEMHRTTRVALGTCRPRGQVAIDMNTLSRLSIGSACAIEANMFV